VDIYIHSLIRLLHVVVLGYAQIPDGWDWRLQHWLDGSQMAVRLSAWSWYSYLLEA
jgi:hypothetical protein